MEKNSFTDTAGPDLTWWVAGLIGAMAVLVLALPALALGIALQRVARERSWSTLLWLALSAPSAVLFYALYTHGLDRLITAQLTDLLQTAKVHHADLARWNLGRLWSETWPLWLRTVVAAPAVALWREQATRHLGTGAAVLQQQARNQARAGGRAAARAARRIRRLARVPDAVGGHMVVGVPIGAAPGDLPWVRRAWPLFQRWETLPLSVLRHHLVCLGATGSGKTALTERIAYGSYKLYRTQVIYLDAKGEEKREEERDEDSAARFVATMQAAGARRISVFPATAYNGWQGTPAALHNRLLSVIDFSESPYYGDVAANAVYLVLHTPVTPRSSAAFLANLQTKRLEALYKEHPRLLERVRRLDPRLLSQVQMRYEVFFQAMAGQLDGNLSYEDADAVYLRVRGFTLRQEAPRLGRFLIYDFMSYIAERRAAGVSTLLIIDEANALRMREEMSVLFEQVRTFGGSLVITAQGYAGLGQPEYATRMLDAANTYVLHSSSDPFPVAKRAGQRLRLATSYSETEEGAAQRQTREEWEWKVPEHAVMQQEAGQAFWINRGRAQQALTARVPLSRAQIQDAWQEIHRQEEAQQHLWEQKKQQRRQAARGQPILPPPEPPV